MESAILFGDEGEESDDVDEAYGTSWLGALGSMANGRRTVRSSEANVKIHNGGSPIVSRKGTMSRVKVKDVSRLKQYHNRRRPQDEHPPLLHEEPDEKKQKTTKKKKQQNNPKHKQQKRILPM